MSEWHTISESSLLTWTQKFDLIEAELRKDPARSDMLIAKTIGLDKVSKASVYRAREALVADGKLRDVPIGARVSTSGKMVAPNGADNHGNHNGSRIHVPEGKKVSDVIQEAIKVEEGGMTVGDVARLVGMGRASYYRARAIVLLSQRTDLSPSDTILVREALDEMNETHRAALAYEKLGALVKKVWGGGRKPRDRKGASRRQASFSHAMTIIIDTCIAAPEIEIPLLSDTERVTAVRQVDEAISGLRRLKRKIVTGRFTND